MKRKHLLGETKIGEFLSMGVELDGEEVGLFIASSDVSASCGFNFAEWENFVDGINKAHENFRKIKKID